MLCCVYTVINKLGLAEPEARPTPAQTVRCLSNFFFFFSNFIVMNWTVYSSGDPQTPVSLGCCHCCAHCWCWPSLPGLCCCCDSVVAELCCCGCEAGGRRLAETFSSSGVWAEARDTQTVTLIHSQGPAWLHYPDLSLVTVHMLQPSHWPDLISGPQPGPVLPTGPSLHALLEPSLTSEENSDQRGLGLI